MNTNDELKTIENVLLDRVLDAIASAVITLSSAVNALEARVETLERKERARQPISFPW